MPIIDCEVEVWCASCGAGLCGQSKAITRRGRQGIDVEPCKKCQNDAYERGIGDAE